MRRLLGLIRRAYLRIGMHTAPPGTLLFYAHRSIHSVMYSGRLGYASRFAMRRSRYGGTFYYDIVRARRTRQVDGIALIFFMGIGDYLMATPLIEELHLAHPDLPIYAYASSNADSVNSPLVFHLLRANPVFDRVFSFRGRPGWQWVDYDFRDALTNVPENFLILPVIYESVADISHRETALLETFGLPVKLPVRGPILHTSGDLTEPAKAILSRIRQRIQESSAHRVVCCHFGARSSGYVYPHINQLARRLLAEDCLVVSFTKAGFEDDNLIEIDVTSITPNDTILLLKALKAEQPPLYIVSVNSLMWPISAGLDIPNLGMHVFLDHSVHQYLYPNIFVITQHNYERVSASRLFLTPMGKYDVSLSKSQVEFADFDPEFVADCFLRFIAMT